ncbi:MAG: hypothetical protein CBC25_00925 [Pelagibacteraceae bacterium TMED65]|nr:MAG: hypothetical protein CBC25_00925 [Pelagibacteraceae bacterium TMED65]
MIKKRLIFTLLYSNDFFCQSRNFDLQEVGDINWLKKNYNFKNISFYIDELIVLDISREKKDKKKFIENVRQISELCFVPITVGGGIKSLEDAKYFLTNGSDKILVNTEFLKNYEVINDISSTFGEQSIIIGIDLKKDNKDYYVYSDNGQNKIKKTPKDIFKEISELRFGEIFLNSITKDGTGTGLDYEILSLLPDNFKKPIILSGGTGNFNHIYETLKKTDVDAISTSNLLNFVGDGLIKTRNKLLEKDIPFPKWDMLEIKKLEASFGNRKNNL